MTDTHAITALKLKRVKLNDEIRNLQGQLRAAVADLDHVEAVLRLLDPSLKIPRAAQVSKENRAHYRGETSKIVLDTLKAAPAPITTVEMAEKVMDAKGIDKNDRALRILTIKRVYASLRHWKAHRGVVNSITRPGEPTLWVLANQSQP